MTLLSGSSQDIGVSWESPVMLQVRTVWVARGTTDLSVTVIPGEDV